MDAVVSRLEAEQSQYGTHMDSKEAIEAHLQEAAERKAAIDEERAALAGTEVAFAKAIAAEQAQFDGDPRTGLTRQDIEIELEAAAARKKRYNEARAAKGAADVAHVREVVEKKKRSVQQLESEKGKLDQELQAMEEKQKALETRLQQPAASGTLSEDGRPMPQ